MADNFNIDIPIDNLQDLNAGLSQARTVLTDIGTLFNLQGVSTKVISDAQKKLNSDLYQQDVYQNGIQSKLKEIADLQMQIQTSTFRAGMNAAAADAERNRLAVLLNAEQSKYNGLLEKANQLESQKNALLAGRNLLGKIGLNLAVNQYDTLKQSKGAVQFLVNFFGILVDVFKTLDEDAFKFRQLMGSTRIEGQELDKAVWHTAIGLANVGVTADHIFGAMFATAGAIGTAQAATMDMAKDMALFSAQLGISAGRSAEFLKSMGMIGRATMSSQTDMLYFAKEMANAAKVPLDEVMKDVAEATKEGYKFMAKSPMALIKAAVEAKRLGTSLQDAAKSANSLIDFSNSINAEMEASVLLGESINLQKARELSYSRNLAGLNAELVNLAQKARFEQLDPIQQEAFAKAIGKTVIDVAKMLQAQRELNRIRGDASLAKELEKLEEMKQATADIAKNTIETSRYQLTTQQNQARLAAVSQSWSRIVQKIAETYLPAINNTLKFVADTLDYIGDIPGIGIILGFGVPILAFVGTLKALGAASKAVGSAIGGAFKGLGTGLMQLSNPRLFIGVGVIAALGLSLLPFVYAMKQAQGIEWKTLGIMATGLVALAAAAAGAALGFELLLPGAGVIAVLGASLIPFAKSLEIGSRSIVNFGTGIKNIATGLETIQNISFTNTILQVGLLTMALIDLNEAINDIPDIKVEKLKSLSMEAVAPATAGLQLQSESNTDKLLESVNDKLNTLISAVKAGGNVYLDNDLVGITASRNKAFTNSVGPNKVR